MTHFSTDFESIPEGLRQNFVNPFRSRARNLTKDLPSGTLVCHEPGGKKDIIVHFARCSGSTWLAENSFGLGACKRNVAVPVSCEVLAEYPEYALRWLKDHSDLPGVADPGGVMSRPSRTQQGRLNRSSSNRVNSWLGEVSDEMTAFVESALEVFEIGAYDARKALPRVELLGDF